MKRSILILCCLSFILFSSAQKQANFWYFGNYAGLSFGGGIPVPLTNGALSTGEGCSSISTSAGNLEFYTDGRFVYNKNHQQMPNGFGLFGHSSSTQSGIIVPKPSSTTQYYIFTVDAYDNNLANGLAYSRVDMTLNGGLGDVVVSEKNVSLVPLTCEKVTAVGHSDGNSFWVITKKWGNSEFYAYRITSSGVNTTPVISSTGPPMMGDMQMSKGYLKVSPDGTKIAMANNTAFNMTLYSFNNTTGQISHILTDENFTNPGGWDPGGPYGVEFSSNSQRLYIAEWKANRKIYQYDLSSGDPTTILNSRVVVGSVSQNLDPIGALQLGPDNRIYIARQGSTYLSRINQPNQLGVACGFIENALGLAGRQSRYGLPPFVQSFFYLTADFYWDEPACAGYPTQFYTSASDNPDSVRWTFPDGSQSTLLNPVYLFPGPGLYGVTLIVYLYGQSKTVLRFVQIRPNPEISLGNDTTICLSEAYYLDAGGGYASYLWHNGDTTQITYVATSGAYWCLVANEWGCTRADTVNITVNENPAVDAGDEQTIPENTSTTLNGSATGGSGNYSYHWEPADRLVNPNVAQPATVVLVGTTLFTLTVTDNTTGCTGSDQVLVTVIGGVLTCLPYASPNLLCPGAQSQLFAMASGGTGTYSYTWTSVPAGLNSTLANPVVNPTVNTTYYVSVNDGENVTNGSTTVNVHSLPVPNAGPDQTVPHGTPAVLQGGATGGSGVYIYNWEPADKLINAHVPQPTTVNLFTSQLFTLSVTDVQTGCICAEADAMTVIVSGDALSANPMVTPDTVCSGTPVYLYALPGGGSGTYSYAWSSNPPGLVSSEANPYHVPMTSTTYSVTVNDGYNSATGSISVHVNPSPYLNLGADATLCVYDTVILDAGNPGATYLWSNGSTERTVKVATTGIGFNMHILSVTVTTPDGCSASDTRTIIFDFAACTGIDDPNSNAGFAVYPNPGSGLVRIGKEGGCRDCMIRVTDRFGRAVLKNIPFEQDAGSGVFILDLGPYPPGLYMISITNEDGMNINRKYLLVK